MNQNSSSNLRSFAILTAMTAILAWSVFFDGMSAASGALQATTVGILGVAVLVPQLRRREVPLSAPMARGLTIPMGLFLAYLLFQMTLLPSGVLALLSPRRADLLTALEPVLGPATFAPLSVIPEATLQVLVQVIVCIVVLLLIREAVSGQRDRPWTVALPLIALATIEALTGFVRHALEPASAFLKGTFLNRNHFAGFLEMCVPFAVGYAWILYERLQSGVGSRLRGALLLGLVLASAVTMITAIMGSLSRTGAVAAVVSLVVLLALRPRVRWRAKWQVVAVPVFALLLLLTLVPAKLLERYSNLFSGHLEDDIRTQLWKATLALIADFPIFGCGAGSFESTFHRYNPMANFIVDYAHNDYLQALSELGIAGFAIVIVFAVAILRQAAKGRNRTSVRGLRSLNAACAASFAAILIHSLTDFNLHTPANALVLSWVAGIVAWKPEKSE